MRPAGNSATPVDEFRAHLLDGVALALLVVTGVIGVVDLVLWVTAPRQSVIYQVDLALSAALAAAVVWVRMLARQSRVGTAAWVLVGALGLRLIITVGAVTPETFASLAPIYLVVIVLAQVLMGPRAALAMALGCVPMFALAYASLTERPDIRDHLPENVLSCLLLFGAVGLLVHITMDRLTHALIRYNVLLADNERARREMQDSEEQFRALAESSPTGIVIQQDGHLVYGNPRFAEMARCLRREIAGLSLWDFFSPEDANVLRAQITRRRNSGGAAQAPDQLVFRPLKGPPLWCEVAVADAIYRNREAMIANLLDVTERVRAQLEVQRERDFSNNIINAADAIIMALDSEGRIVRFNPAGERITGYTEAELIGHPMWEQLVPEGMRQQSKELLAEITAGQTRGQTESTWITKTGEERIIAWRYVTQTDAEGRVLGIIAVGIDVTQQRILERQSMAAERLRALGQMAGGVAHDLNNTLAGILGPAELLLLEEQDPRRREDLTAIVSAARRGAETVRRIQRFSQARTDLDRQVFDLRQLVDEVIYTTRPRWRDQAQRQGTTIRIVNEVPPDILVEGSSGEIGNVLTNLIVNACEAMPDGGDIIIAGRQQGSNVEFWVTDTGTGMSEETLANIFQPFFSTKGAENSGLGLAVIRGIVLRHGGNIEVTSTLGVGTTFTVSLPAASQPREEEPPATPAVSRTGLLRFLVVDDTRPIADFAAVALRRMGHSVTVAYGGEDALQQLQSNGFDVLLTDYGMEGVSGLQLAREARRLHPHIRTILMTGWDVAGGDFSEFDAALPKPFTIGELTSTVERVIPDAA